MSGWYFEGAIKFVERLMKMDENDKEFWENFYRRSDYCISGHIVSAEKAVPSGFFMRLISSTNGYDRDPEKLPKQITSIPFSCGLQTMFWHSGVFSSKMEDGFLVPQFSHVILS
eukprot:TRINITY_DN70680_c0_g1_i1.p1 TRINITY_DN70680_c0_g1~~TRINITY_DN70680_c0_g1_i1.p1  ORF type:complete len:114 (+),score=14.00 TRINITY_DN70680_c0_g1_i1:99-440(+)